MIPNDSTKPTPDYIYDSYFANVLAKRLENYYKNKGYHGVKAWVEQEEQKIGKPIQNVRSNIVMDVRDI